MLSETELDAIQDEPAPRLTELELEKLFHVNTRMQLANLGVEIVQKDAVRLNAAIRARLKLKGEFQITPDGTVITIGTEP